MLKALLACPSEGCKVLRDREREGGFQSILHPITLKIDRDYNEGVEIDVPITQRLEVRSWRRKHRWSAGGLRVNMTRAVGRSSEEIY